MKALILAAGLGTRLRPWTLKHPKALVPVGGVPMLQRVLQRLISFGFDDFVINIHHFGDQIIDFVDYINWEIRVQISDERECLLDTGGGLLQASRLLMARNNAPFLVHNSDILCNVDLSEFMQFHLASGNDISLLVSDRESSRKLLFNRSGFLCGWHNLTTDEFRPSEIINSENTQELGFSGIYIIGENGVLALKEYSDSIGEKTFPVLDFFLRSMDKIKIGAYEVKDLKILDIGKPAALQQAEYFIKNLT